MVDVWLTAAAVSSLQRPTPVTNDYDCSVTGLLLSLSFRPQKRPTPRALTPTGLHPGYQLHKPDRPTVWRSEERGSGSICRGSRELKLEVGVGGGWTR